MEPLIDKTRTGQLVVLVALSMLYVFILARGQTPPPMLSQAFIAALGTYLAGRGYSASQQKGIDHEQA
jgi:hypothetical protein